MKKILAVILFIGIFSFCQAETLESSKQLLVVTTSDSSNIQGQLQRYTRNPATFIWQKKGEAIPVVIGKNGMTFEKKEGDLKTPAGIYKIGPIFGFAAAPLAGMKMPYQQLTSATVCVDDTQSQYYGKIVEENKVKTDWNSGEQMRTVPLYQWGAVIQYNMNSPQPGAGSCIFMHIWRAPNLGTAGCVAMAKNNLVKVLKWMNPLDQPVIVILTNADYAKLQKQWSLP